MGEMADLIKNAGLDPSSEPNVVFEELPGDNEDISGYDPLDYGDDIDDDDDDGPEDVAEDTTNFATSFKNGPAIPENRTRQAQPQQKQAPVEKGNVHAKLRIVERQNRVMEDRLNKLIEAITNPVVQEEEEQEPEIVPFEQDPLTHMVSKLDSVAKKVDKQALTQKQLQERERMGKALERADNLTYEMAQKIGENNWQDAMAYLAEVRIEDFLDRNPERTRDEASNIIGAAILKEKINLVNAGRNPAELYLKDAIRFGFRPAEVREQVAQPKAQAAARNPKDEIRSQNSKGAGTRTTASLNGAPAKQKLSAKAVVGMKESDFRDLVDEVSKERGKNATLKLSDFILPNS